MAKKNSRTNQLPATVTGTTEKGTIMENNTEQQNGNQEENTNNAVTLSGNTTDNVTDGTGDVSGTNDTSSQNTTDTQQAQENTSVNTGAPANDLVVDINVNNAPLISAEGIIDKSVSGNEDQTKTTEETTEAPVQETVVAETVSPTVATSGFGLTIDTSFRILDEYIVEMAPNKMHDASTGGRQQRSFRQALMTILNSANETNYVEVYDELFNRLSSNASGVFHEYNRLRFHDSMGLDAKEVNQWARFLCGIVDLSNRNTRKLALTQIDLANMLDESKLNASAVNQLSSYLGA